MNDKPIGLFVGRFQPFHLGHFLVIQGMVKMCRKVVIVIGSSQEQRTKLNPFTFEERREMIQRALQAEDIIPVYDVEIMGIPDVEGDEKWVEDILAKAGDVEKVWTGTPWTKECFEKKGIAVQDIKEVPGISATEIRKHMKEGGDWKPMVPKDVANYLIDIEAEEKIQ